MVMKWIFEDTLIFPIMCDRRVKSLQRESTFDFKCNLIHDKVSPTPAVEVDLAKSYEWSNYVSHWNGKVNKMTMESFWIK